MKPGEVEHWFEIPKRPYDVLKAASELLEVLEEKRRDGELPRWRMEYAKLVGRKRKLPIIFEAPPDPAILAQVDKDVDARRYMFE